MTIKDITDRIEAFAPVFLAEEWDSVGLMLGSDRGECSGVMCTLDLDLEVAERAVENGCNLIVTHHPFFFRPVGSLDYDDAKSRLVAYLIKNDIAVYSAHTNMDKADGGLCCELAHRLGASDAVLDGIGVSFKVSKTTLGEFAKLVGKKLGDLSVKTVGNVEATVESVFLVSGSGADAQSYARAKDCADVFVTGDIKHHMYIDAINDGMNLIEYSHYHSEIIVQDIFKKILADCGVTIMSGNQKCPFRVLEEL